MGNTSSTRAHRVAVGWACRPAVAALLVLIASSPAGAQLDKLLKGLGGGGLSDARIGSGLKEALQVATEKTVSLTGKTDGYFGNEAIKILMPEKLRTFESGLRAVGYGSQIDELVLGMNRAAEQAAPKAKQIFRQYQDLVSRFEAIPFVKSQTFDLDGYVVDRGLTGLFHVLGEQEKQIRTNPAARTTDLLREVFKR